MAQDTQIQWADDSQSFWWGCQEHGPGCANCYARDSYMVAMKEREAGRVAWESNRAIGRSGIDLPAVRFWIPGAAATLSKLNRIAKEQRRRRLVFVNSMSDTFEEFDGPVIDFRDGSRVMKTPDGLASGRAGNLRAAIRPATLDDMRAAIFAEIDSLDWLVFLLLTKRPENVPAMVPPVRVDNQRRADARNERGELFRENVWIGTTVERVDQMHRIDALRKCHGLGSVLFVSAEPLLSHLPFAHRGRWFCGECGYRDSAIGDTCSDCGGFVAWHDALFGLDWVIVGGESGRNARQTPLPALRGLVEQCRAASVPVFVKQLGACPVDRANGSEELVPVRLKHSKGGDPSEWPEEFRVREFPKFDAVLA